MTDLAKIPTVEELGELVRKGRQGPQVECPLVHTFIPGMYLREVTVPAGTLVVTKIHHTTHPFVVSKGRIAVWTEEAGVQIIQAPFKGITKAGTVRLAVAIEETVWTTYHATDETDIETLERQLATDPADLLPSMRTKKLL